MMRLAAIAALLCAGAAAAQPTFGPAYGDGMVLQRGQPVTVEGRTGAGRTVSGMLGGDPATATADDEGRFVLSFPARDASDTPLMLSIEDDSGTAALFGLLIGDVYLCSGQSNMELAVERALNFSNVMRIAEDNSLRLLTIPKTTAPLPQQDFAAPVMWKAADADSVAPFSAACYFMAARLRSEEPGVPIGLINSNWGGSAANAWLDPQGVAALYGQTPLDQLGLHARDPLAAARAFAPQWYEWWRANDNGREPWTNPDTLNWKPVPQISFWNEWTGTGLDTQPAANVWLRQTVTLTAEQAARDGTLSIGAIDDLDFTWVNGRPVGYIFGWGVERSYTVPADTLREGENTILIAVSNMWDTGGFYAGPDRLFFTAGGDGAALPLGEGWEYSIGTVESMPPRAPWDANTGYGVMHNAMIAPLGPMRLAGVAWYQGEADIGQPDYDATLRELFAGWRRQFGGQARMLVVQLADFGERRATPAASGWAQLRQDQMQGVEADDNAVLVTAIDLGEPTDIHPANKNVLGERLALAARDEAMPMPASARLQGEEVTVTFTGIHGGLRALGGPYALGIELCGETQESCRFVLPALDANRMTIGTDGQPVTRIRHAWADAPIVNLYDARGLPVPGFELEIER